MGNDTKDLTVGNIKNCILSFELPIFLSQLFQHLYNTVVSLIVGNFRGKESLAAVASSGNLIFLFTSFFIGLSVEAGVVTTVPAMVKKSRKRYTQISR